MENKDGLKRNSKPQGAATNLQLLTTGKLQLMTTELPRGVRVFSEPNRPLPFAVQWRVDGKRKTKFFAEEKTRDRWVAALVKDTKAIGVDAYRLDTDETRAWRAFRLLVGDADLDAVARCWLQSQKQSVSITVAKAVSDYLAVKTKEGVSRATIGHAKAVFRKFEAKCGSWQVGQVKREMVAEWLEEIDVAPITQQTHLKRLHTLFRWLQVTRQLQHNPCDGLKPPTVVAEEIEVMTPEDLTKLFRANLGQDKEVLGRLALEAFAGMRYSSAAVFKAADIRWDEKGLVLPAKSIKTRRRQFIDGLPDNLFAWLKWSEPEKWKFTERQYLQKKSQAFIRADVPHPHNVMRHSCATYLVAHLRDVGKAASILCHSPAMLFRHYRGNATQEAGRLWFSLTPIFDPKNGENEVRMGSTEQASTSPGAPHGAQGGHR